jgi:hypothetical protein
MAVFNIGRYDVQNETRSKGFEDAVPSLRGFAEGYPKVLRMLKQRHWRNQEHVRPETSSRWGLKAPENGTLLGLFFPLWDGFPSSLFFLKQGKIKEKVTARPMRCFLCYIL